LLIYEISISSLLQSKSILSGRKPTDKLNVTTAVGPAHPSRFPNQPGSGGKYAGFKRFKSSSLNLVHNDQSFFVRFGTRGCTILSGYGEQLQKGFRTSRRALWQWRSNLFRLHIQTSKLLSISKADRQCISNTRIITFHRICGTGHEWQY